MAGDLVPGLEFLVRARSFVRTRGGDVVHVAGCPSASTGIVWSWANSKGDVLEVARFVTEFGLHLCRHCDPIPELRPVSGPAERVGP